MRKILIFITLLLYSAGYASFAQAQIQSEPQFNLFKSFRRLTNNSLVKIENLIEDKKFEEAISLLIKSPGELNDIDRVEITKKLKPIAEKKVEEAMSELLATKSGSTLSGLDTSSEDILKKYETVLQTKDIIIFFNLKETIKLTIDSIVKNWLEGVENIININGYSTEPSEKLKNFSKIVRLSEESSYAFCERLITSKKGKEQEFYNYCEKFLTPNSSKKIRSLGLTSVLNDVTQVNGALEKLEYLSSITKKWRIQDNEWREVVLPLIPNFKLMRSNEILKWLSSKEGDAGIYLQSNNPDQNIVKEKKISRFKSGETTIVNPEYLEAERNYQQATLGYQNCEANYRVARFNNPYAIYLCGFNYAVVSEAQRKLSQTNPVQTLQKFSAYNIDVSIVQVTTNYTASYYIYSSKAGRYVYKKINNKNSKEFRLADGINPNDQDVVISLYSKESDIKKYIETPPVFLPSKELFDDILKADDVGDPITSFKNPSEETPAKGRVDSMNSNSIFSTPQATTAVINKLLSNSVVVINGKSSLGAGFFVKNRFVLTNHHVIDGAPMVEIETKDGRKTTGLVIVSDLGLDLALIATTFEGPPIELVKETPTIGEDVFALGHPGGLKFSASRGIISAVRNIKTINGLGLMATYIQTDVAINPGNSGGPLVLDGKAVGINTFRRAEPGAVGLGFALSSVEIRKWIDEKIPR